MRIAVPLFSLLGLTSALIASTHAAGEEPGRFAPQATAPLPNGRPFAVGEKLTYQAKVNFLNVGTGTMRVEAIDTVRGIPAYHTTFEVKGRMLFYKVQDKYESWFDTTSLSSLRYTQDIDEGSYERERHFEIFPDRQVFHEGDKPEEPSVAQPLDDGSFLYFVRTLPLEVGETLEFHRYFRPDRNPVRLEVLRREKIKVPAGEYDAIVVKPQILGKGIFSEKSNAEIWFADDSTRVMLRMRSGLPFGTLTLELRKIENTNKPSS